MTGYKSKKAMAEAKLEDDDTQVYQDHGDALTIAYQSGYYDGKKAAQPAQEPVVCCQQYDTCLQPCTPKGEYLAQRPWVGLTAEEATKCCTISAIETWFNFENALRIKNT